MTECSHRGKLGADIADAVDGQPYYVIARGANPVAISPAAAGFFVAFAIAAGVGRGF